MWPFGSGLTSVELLSVLDAGGAGESARHSHEGVRGFQVGRATTVENREMGEVFAAGEQQALGARLAAQHARPIFEQSRLIEPAEASREVDANATIATRASQATR